MQQRHAAPSVATVDTLLEVAKRRRFAGSVFRTISDIVRKNPALKGPALQSLKRFDAQQTYMAHLSNGDPKKDLADVIKRLEKP